jgi:hypothetical protein
MDISSRLNQAKSPFVTETTALVSTPVAKAAAFVSVENPVLSGNISLTDPAYAIKDLGPQVKAPSLPNGQSTSNSGLPGGKIGGSDFEFGDHGPSGFIDGIINGRGGRPGGSGFDPSGGIIPGGKDPYGFGFGKGGPSGSGDEGDPGSGFGFDPGNSSKYIPGGKKGAPGTPGSGPVGHGGNGDKGGFGGFGDDGAGLIGIGSGGGPNSLGGIIDRSKKGYGSDKEGEGQKNGGFIGGILAGPIGYAIGSAIGKAYDGNKADAKASTEGCKDLNIDKCANPPEKPEETKPDNGGKPDPNGGGGRPDDNSTGNGGGVGGPRSNVSNASNVFFPSDEGGGGTPFSNIASQYMPADDSSGGGTPRSSVFRPSDESAGGNNPHSAVASVAVKANVSSLFKSAVVQR